ncbi:MAG: dipeptidase [Gemmatimonadales bacterium]|nr:dipeptidase [Gemmatimonadota bacterium]MDX2056860.1 dipeptidase [Gemmatimonadales bacterium]
MDQNFVTRERDRMLKELVEFLAIPSISTLPNHAQDCRKAAGWLMDQFRRLGCAKVELLEGEGHPIVWAESPVIEGAPTVLVYGHYDVQPVDPINEWKTPPFEPTIRDGRLYARGAADDKGQVYCLVKAYEAILDQGKRPPINIRFLIEGEEECGGHVISDLLDREPERAQADAILICDMAYFDVGWPAVYTALRGLCYAELHVRTLERDLHSGTYGGAAPNAMETLVRLLADLKSRSGKINLPKLYKSVKKPSKAELKGWADLPFDEKRFLKEEVTGKALTGIQKVSVLERTWALPTFEIHGIKGGFVGDGAKTVIPAAAMAKVSLRLVPGLPFAKVARWLTKTAKRLAPKHAEVEVRILHGGDPVQVDVSHPSFQVLDEAFKETVGRGTVPVRAGGSIPVVTQFAKSGSPVILTGIGLPDDGLHSPNEKLDLQQLWDGITVFGRFFEKMGGK